MFTKYFWKLSVERAIKSAAQAAILAFGGGATNLLSVPGIAVLGAAGAGFVLSVLTSIASNQISEEGTPSLVPPPKSEEVPPVS